MAGEVLSDSGPPPERIDVPDPLDVAVVCALAGVRRGNRVATVDVDPRTAAAVLAGAQVPGFAPDEADVVVVGAADAVAAALPLLRAGGRLVGMAADARSAEQTARAAGLQRLVVVPTTRGVAWSAVAARRDSA